MVAQVYRDTVEFTPAAREEWMDDAACLWYPKEYFFPDTKKGQREAIAICDRCEVRFKCLVFALAAEKEKDGNRRTGIFGGKTPKERKELQKLMNDMIKEKNNG